MKLSRDRMDNGNLFQTDGAQMVLQRSGVRPYVCLSHRSTAPTAAGRFAAERPCLQQILIDSCGRRATSAGAQQQMRVASC